MIRILMGINIIKNGIFPFFFWTAASPASPGYTGSFCVCQWPGRNIYRRVLPFFTALDSGVFPGAPGASQLSPEDHPINGGFPGDWEIGNALKCRL